MHVHRFVAIGRLKAVVRPQHRLGRTLVGVQRHELADLDVAPARKVHSAFREVLPELAPHHALGNAVLQLERREQERGILAYKLTELSYGNLCAELLENPLHQLLSIGIGLVILPVDVPEHFTYLTVVYFATVVRVIWE